MAPPLVRVRLKYPDVDTLVDRFAPNVTRGGIFLASREPLGVGSLIRFEVSLLSGTPVLAGEGRVTWVKPFDPSAPARPHGMGVSFTRIEPGSREMLRRLIEKREATARRATDAGPTPAAARQRAPVELPAEIDTLEDTALRRAVERARVLAARVDDVEALRTAEPEPAPTLQQALADLPRYLERRRGTGSNRITEPKEAGDGEPATAAVGGRDPDAPS